MEFLDGSLRIARTWSINTVNSLVFLFSGGTKVLHEGRFMKRCGTWINWNRTFKCQPEYFKKPRTEEEICDIVRSSKTVRVVGAGHGFNASPVTSGTLISLEDYNAVRIDKAKMRVHAQAGVRLRDLTRMLRENGLALPVQGSTDAQSIGGLIGTDVHGTGRDNGFLSEQLRSLRIVNAAGEVKAYQRGTPEFHAAIGGLGTCGIVTEAELECVPAFNLRKSTRVVHRQMAEDAIDTLLRRYDHLSFYYVGGVDTHRVQMNTWMHTEEPPSRLYGVQKVTQELLDMLFLGYLLGLARVLDISQVFANAGLFFLDLVMNGRSCVYPSQVGFSRRLYYHHDELEYGIPYAKYKQCLSELLEMLKRRRFVTIIEVRFTPDTSQATIAPGVGRRTCYINLVPSLSVDAAEVFAEAEPIFLRYGGQVHLGKATFVTGGTMRTMYGMRWREFRRVQRRQDPGGKFVNAFVARLLTDIEPRRPSQKVEDGGTRLAG